MLIVKYQLSIIFFLYAEIDASVNRIILMNEIVTLLSLIKITNRPLAYLLCNSGLHLPEKKSGIRLKRIEVY